MILALCLYAAITSENHKISSAHASYKEDCLFLEGNVRLEHPIGILIAESATLRKEELSDTPFTYVTLSDHVSCTFPSGEHLSCDRAEIDMTTATANLFSNQDRSVICEVSLTQESHIYPLKLQGKQMRCQFAEKEHSLKQLHGSEDIIVEYMNTLFLKADNILYEEFCCTASSHHLCELIYQGETLFTPSLSLNLSTHVAHLVKPHGSIATALLCEGQGGVVTSSCDELLWDMSTNTLCLQGNASLQEEHLGTLHASQQLTLIEEQGRIRQLDIQGPARLQRGTSVLQSPRALHIEKGIATAQGSTEEPVQYTDQELSISGNTLQVFYEEATYTPSHLTWNGSIHMQIHNDASSSCCGIADEASYDLVTHRLHLRAHEDHFVLFLDQEQGVTLKAHEVQIFDDPFSAKRVFQAIGPATFTFSDSELLSLRHLFPAIFSQQEKHDP